MNIKELEINIKNKFIYSLNNKISNNEYKIYIIELNYFFDLIYNVIKYKTQKYIFNFINEYDKIINDNIFNCIKNELKLIYNYLNYENLK